MDKYDAEQLIKKILNRDYDRWIRYADECIKERSAYTESFHVWKNKQGMIDEDARLLAELFSN